jgi:hypothetical protein
LYLVDGGRVRRVDRSGRIDALTSVPAPGEPALTRVTGIAFDGTGNLYLSEYEANRVRRVTPSGIMTTFAGTGSSYGPRGDGGPATAATVPFPGSITTAPDGSVYVLSDGIRKIGPTGVITTVVGPTAGFAGDGGPAALAALSNPRDLATDASGNLYIADAGNRRVRKVSTGGTISTLAGNGYRSFSGDGGPATAARLWWLPGALVSGSEGTTVVDAGNQRVRRIDPSGTIRTLRESSPWGMARDRFGNVFLSEGNQVVKVTTEGAVTTVAGTGEAGLSGDGGPATWARLSGARSLAVDGSGNLYIEDNGNGRIRRVDPSGTITTFAGSREAHLPLGDAESTGKTIERGQFNSMVIAPDGTLFWATD